MSPPPVPGDGPVRHYSIQYQPMVCSCCVYSQTLWRDPNLCGLCPVKWCHKEGLIPSSPCRKPPTEISWQKGLDFQSAYWQFPMDPQSIEKTASCPGPGYGLWEFKRIPYGLTGTTQTCQRGLDNILQDCKDCTDNHVNDCIR